MAHEIFGDRFLGVREPAWHGLGTVIAEPIPIAQAIVDAGLGYDVVKVPMMFGWPQGETDADKITVHDTGKVALVREPVADDDEPRTLGVASDGFEIVQNTELGKMLEPLNEHYPIETVGALRNGAITFLTLDMGGFEVAGEEVKKFLLVSNGHDGSRGLNIKDVRTRIVCANTLEAGENESSALDFSLRHVSNVKDEAQWILDLIGKLQTREAKIDEVMQAMGTAELDDETLTKMVEAAYPMPKKPRKLQIADQQASEATTKEQVKAALALRESVSNNNTEYERATERVQKLQTATLEQYDRICDTFPDIEGTVWAGLNAVTEVSNWREGRTPEASVMFGERRDEGKRAYAVAAAAVTV